jgi:hypothetical protein
LDGVEPLLAIADLAGGSWPVEARAACVELYGGRQIDDESIGIRLLADIRGVVGDRDRMASADLLDALHDLDEAPWGEWYGKPITNRALATLLKPYGIKSRTIKLRDGKTPKGFLREQFESAWSRYPPPKTPLRHNPLPMRVCARFKNATKTPRWRIEIRAIPLHKRKLAGWRIETPRRR